MKDVVVLIHGLGRTARSMRRLALFLNRAGFETQLFSYQSRQSTLEQVTTGLAATIEALRLKHARIHFVTHSLGGIILRSFLGTYPAPPNWIGQSVMLAPPHHGSKIIDFWRGGTLRYAYFKAFMGKLALSLHTGSDSLPNQLSKCEAHRIGIIAGTRSIEFWFNPLFKTTHDGKVSIASTHLHARHHHIETHATHTFIMNHDSTRQQVLNFLQHGHFA